MRNTVFDSNASQSRSASSHRKHLMGGLTALAAVLALGYQALPERATAAETAAPDAVAEAVAEAKSGVYAIDPNHSKITWAVSHLGFSTYYGQIPNIRGELKLDVDKVENSTLDVTIPVRDVGTLHEALDGHLRNADFLDVEAFPEAHFRATKITRVGPREARIDGDLTLRGKTQPVSLATTFNKAGANPLNQAYTLGFSAKGSFKRSDFGINYGLPVVGDEVALLIETELLVPKTEKSAGE